VKNAQSGQLSQNEPNGQNGQNGTNLQKLPKVALWPFWRKNANFVQNCDNFRKCTSAVTQMAKMFTK